jgi:hypothetical protein
VRPPARFLALLVLGLVGSTSGCQSIFGNVFKVDYWDEIHAESDKDERARLRDDPATTYFLGIRTTAREVPFQIGVVVSSVYAEGPAARAGLRAGDEIRRLHFAHVRTPGEVRLELTRLFREEEAGIEAVRTAMLKYAENDPPFVPSKKIGVTFFRDGRQLEAEVTLTTREGYLDLRRRRILDLSRYEEKGTNGFYFWKTRTLSPDFVDDYFGVAPPETVRVAQDLDILPLAFGISFLRIERIPIAEATRVTVLSTLFQFSHRGTDVARTLEELIPPAPEGATDL